jgi:hypothetical protein
LGLVVADRLGGGAPEGAPGAVVEFDGDGVLGDVDGDHGVGVVSSEGEFLPGDHDDPGVRRPALRGDRLDRRPWWWAGGAGAAQAAGLGTPGMGDRLGVKVPWRKRWC